jgi:formylglycine-generating enzyme required for sulfatase activity
MVSWNSIQTFIAELNEQTGKNYRLPTEAEWEFAARGGNAGVADDYLYAGGNTIGDVAWYTSNSGSTTHPVGLKSPNQLGVYDMSGNVWEWVNDWYGSSYYSSSPTSDPQGPSSGSARVLRGGRWSSNASGARVTFRSSSHPESSYNDYGFRLALSP